MWRARDRAAAASGGGGDDDEANSNSIAAGDPDVSDELLFKCSSLLARETLNALAQTFSGAKVRAVYAQYGGLSMHFRVTCDSCV